MAALRLALRTAGGGQTRKGYKEFSYQELLDLRKTNWDEYARLFEAEYKYKPGTPSRSNCARKPIPKPRNRLNNG